MGFDLEALRRAVDAHGAVIRVVIAELAGSAPRGVGTAMLVWADGQHGTIGGGALEYEAAARARGMLASGSGDRVDRIPLGPVLNQCCGGAVVLLSESWNATRLKDVSGDVVVRPLPGREGEMPLPVRRLIARARDRGAPAGAACLNAWMVEPVRGPERHVWIWGAGHVGRALIGVLSPLPDLRLTWIDTDEARFPAVPEGVRKIVAPTPGEAVGEAPQDATHLVLTYSHALDLEICHRALCHGFSALGLIGSATKRARFRSRLAALGHSSEKIDRMTCPIGDPALGKHPQAIAIGVAAALLRGADPAVAGNGNEEERSA